MSHKLRKLQAANKREAFVKEFDDFIKSAYQEILDKIKKNPNVENPENRVSLIGVIKLAVSKYLDSRTHKPQDNSLINDAINIWTERFGKNISNYRKAVTNG